MKKTILGFCLLTALNGQAQTFNSGSNGSDGALNLTTPGTIVFDPVALGIDADGDNVFHFTTINIAAGVTVLLKNGPLRGKPVIWLASGNVTISGTVNLDGQNGYNANIPAELANRGQAEPGPGGYPGGIGATPTSPAQAGSGPGGSRPGPSDSGPTNATGAGHNGAGQGFDTNNPGGAGYGNSALVPLRGGSGGGGGGTRFSTSFGGGGGAGGGAIRIASSGTIAVAGTISANGGEGGNGGPESAPGGSGSGGAIHLIGNVIGGAGILSARRAGSPNSGRLFSAQGRIRLDAFAHQFTGNIGGETLGAPFLVVSPPMPVIRVSTIAGLAVSSTPTGSFVTPDVVLSEPGPVAVAVEARNVPLGTVATIYLTAQNGPDLVVTTTPLAGTLALSTATASIQFATGYSRGFVRANW